jgi:hypothetical protein
MHEVMVPCDCDNIEACRMELYVSDVRIAYAAIKRLQRLRWLGAFEALGDVELSPAEDAEARRQIAQADREYKLTYD